MSKFLYLLKRLNFIITKERYFVKFKYNWSALPQRFQIINKIILKKNYQNYLEVGCFKNENFDQINITNKIGVDPVSGGTLRMSSDEFFLKNKDQFDIIFIDGLHVYEQVKRDIENSLIVLNEDGIILIHDCLPRKIWYQTDTRMSDTWNGDVWKAIVECRTKSEIDTYTCFADEGIGIIKKNKNKNPLNIKISNFKNLKYKDYCINHQEFMNIINIDKLFNEIV